MLKGQRRAVLRLVGLGWYVSLCIVIGIVVGLLLDKQLGVKPLFTLLGLGAGIFLAFWGLFRMLSTVLSETPDNDSSES